MDKQLEKLMGFQVPPILKTYLKYTDGNEAPSLFHFWTGIAVMAGACERRLIIDTGFFQSALNFFVVLVAPPGLGKSSALNIGYKLLKEADFNTLKDSITKEKIIMEMDEMRRVYEIPETKKLLIHSSVTLIESELNMLTVTGQDMVKFLTTMFDTMPVYTHKTKGSGTIEVINPDLNLIGAAVPSWFSSDIGDDVMHMGFLARCIVVYENEPRGSYPIPYMSPEQKSLSEDILSKLDEIGGMYGSITFDAGAQKFYEDWYNANPIDVTEDYKIMGYLVRKRRIHIWKLAALFAVIEGGYIIQQHNIQGAIEVLDFTETKLRLAYTSLGSNKTAYLTNRVITYLSQQEGGIVGAENLLRRFYKEAGMDKQTFKDVMSNIEEMKVAKKIFKGHHMYFKLTATPNELVNYIS